MAREIYIYDENRIYVEQRIVGSEVDYDNYTEIPPPSGLYRAKFTGTHWIESMSDEDIEDIPVPEDPVDPEQARMDILESSMLELADAILILESRSEGK